MRPSNDCATTIQLDSTELQPHELDILIEVNDVKMLSFEIRPN